MKDAGGRTEPQTKESKILKLKPERIHWIMFLLPIGFHPLLTQYKSKALIAASQVISHNDAIIPAAIFNYTLNEFRV